MVQIMSSERGQSSKNRAERASVDGKPEYPDNASVSSDPATLIQTFPLNNIVTNIDEDNEEYNDFRTGKQAQSPPESNNNLSDSEKDWGIVADPWAATSSFVCPVYDNDTEPEDVAPKDEENSSSANGRCNVTLNGHRRGKSKSPLKQSKRKRKNSMGSTASSGSTTSRVSSATSFTTNKTQMQTRRSSLTALRDNQVEINEEEEGVVENQGEMETEAISVQTDTVYCYRCCLTFPSSSAWKKHAVYDHIIPKNPYPIVEMNYIDPATITRKKEPREEDDLANNSNEVFETENTELPAPVVPSTSTFATSEGSHHQPQGNLKLCIGKEKGGYVVKRFSAEETFNDINNDNDNCPPPALEVARSPDLNLSEGSESPDLHNRPLVMPLLSPFPAMETDESDDPTAMEIEREAVVTPAVITREDLEPVYRRGVSIETEIHEVLNMDADLLEEMEEALERAAEMSRVNPSMPRLEDAGGNGGVALVPSGIRPEAHILPEEIPQIPETLSHSETPPSKENGELECAISSIMVHVEDSIPSSPERTVKEDEVVPNLLQEKLLSEDGDDSKSNCSKDSTSRRELTAAVDMLLQEVSKEKERQETSEPEPVSKSIKQAESNSPSKIVTEDIAKDISLEDERIVTTAAGETNSSSEEKEAPPNNSEESNKDDETTNSPDLITGEVDYECRMCHKVFVSDDELEQHFSAEHIRFAGIGGIFEPESPYPPTPQRPSCLEDEDEPIRLILNQGPSGPFPRPIVQQQQQQQIPPRPMMQQVQQQQQSISPIRPQQSQPQQMEMRNLVNENVGMMRRGEMQNMLWRNPGEVSYNRGVQQPMMQSRSFANSNTMTMHAGPRPMGPQAQHPQQQQVLLQRPTPVRMGMLPRGQGGMINQTQLRLSVTSGQQRPQQFTEMQQSQQTRTVVPVSMSGMTGQNRISPPFPTSLHNALTRGMSPPVYSQTMLQQPQQQQQHNRTTFVQSQPRGSHLVPMARQPPPLQQHPNAIRQQVPSSRPVQQMPLGQTMGMQQQLINAQRELNNQFQQRQQLQILQHQQASGQIQRPQIQLQQRQPSPTLRTSPPGNQGQSQGQTTIVLQQRPGPLSQKRPALGGTLEISRSKEPRLEGQAVQGQGQSQRVVQPPPNLRPIPGGNNNQNVEAAIGAVGNPGVSSVRLGNCVTLSVIGNSPATSPALNERHASSGTTSPTSVLAVRGLTVRPASPLVPARPQPQVNQNHVRNPSPAQSPVQSVIQRVSSQPSSPNLNNREQNFSPPVISCARGNAPVVSSPSNVNYVNRPQLQQHAFTVPRAPQPVQRFQVHRAPGPGVVTVNNSTERPERPPTVDLTDDDIQAHVNAQRFSTSQQGQVVRRSLPYPNLQDHRNSRPVRCETCGVIAASSQALEQHKMTSHGISTMMRQSPPRPQFTRPAGSTPPPRLSGQPTAVRSTGVMNRLTAPTLAPPRPAAPSGPVSILRNQTPQTQIRASSPQVSGNALNSQEKFLYIPLIDLGRLDAVKMRKLEEIGISCVVPLQGNNALSQMGIPVMSLRDESRTTPHGIPFDTVLPLGPVNRVNTNNGGANSG